jgi:hypothetical protein
MMKSISRKNFLKVYLLGGINLLVLPYFSPAANEAKTFAINCILPKRMFQERTKLNDIYLTEVIVDSSKKIVQFVLSNNFKITYKYSDSFSIIAGRSQKEAMQMKILLSYSLDKLCQDDKKNIKRNQMCNGDLLQTQMFLEELQIDRYVDLLNSFNAKVP